MTWGRLSGVYADPSSIAGLATLLQNDGFLEELRQLDPQISDEELAKYFADKRFRIGPFRNPDGLNGYGFTMYKGGISNRDILELNQDGPKASSSETSGNDKLACGRQYPIARVSFWLHPASVCAFSLALIGILVIVAQYHFRSESSGFENFMDSQGFGVSFLMTAMGVLVKSCWANIEEGEKKIRTLEPYRNLSLRPSPAWDTILVTSKPHPIVALISALFSLRPFLALIAFDTILAEILTVVLPSVPYKGESIFIAYSLSAILAISIITIMLASLAWVAVRETRVTSLPRRPDTIAAVLLYLCGGRMVKDFQGMAEAEGRLRDKTLMKMGKNYWLGKVEGVDGIERIGIEAKDDVQD
ncbi:hypothetical protein GP486_001539 [Trichoglossum hirsutum]|uniref:Uncharacterized protein n=1 Tax=Trichoglossum hirsutum TaxID=265104 RepID=A0A9P8LGH3_9PEZI|nr:hypothetical protein GP486_001539 [Trichoglossum hirsutum]